MRLVTLGGLRLEGSDLGRQKPLLLLGYLALEGSQTRRSLASLLSSEADHPRAALSTSLRRLRALCEEFVISYGDRIGTRTACDAAELVAALDADHLDVAVALYNGRFLEGLDVALGEEIEEWLYQTREILAHRVRQALVRLGERDAQGEAFDAGARRAEGAYY